jgi:hypothetical protein
MTREVDGRRRKKKRMGHGKHTKTLFQHNVLLERSRRDNSNYTLEEH